jgi:NADP-dependent 3-hydroxy acid dehydrogenase YdfG
VSDLQLSWPAALVTGEQRNWRRDVKVCRAAGVQVMTTARSEPADPIDGVVYASADLQRLKAPPIVKSVQQRWGVSTSWSTCSAARTRQWHGTGRCAVVRCTESNLMPAVRLDRALLPGMLAQGTGVIVHVSSIQRLLPLPESTTAYAAARRRCLRTARPCQRGDAQGVRCRVSPGWVETELPSPWLSLAPQAGTD